MDSYLYESLRRLVAFDTVSSKSNLEALEYLGTELGARGFKVAVQPLELDGVAHGNLVAWAGPPRAGGLIISAHVDTVPHQGQPGWTRDPLVLEIAGDRIYGRGTSDMKGFIAECLDAAAQLELARLTRPLAFVFTASEEVGCLGAKHVGPELEKLMAGTPAPRLAWIGEPSTSQVSHAHKSIVTFNITVRGRGGHSGKPAAGVNAISVMGKAIEVLGRLQEERRRAAKPEFRAIFPDAPSDVLNCGTIRGGLADNIIAEECVLGISYRSLPDEDPLAIHREVAARLSRLDPHDYAAGESRALIEVGPAVVVPPLNSPRGTALEAALFEAVGARDTVGMLYGTDGGWFAQSGIASLICGPGDLDQAHQPNESIRREPFEQGTSVILKVVDRLCCR
ncbi:MAG TPA: M20 family metallopeptidase [Candidatus Binataceae bacterium]|nr:M20 family metallopeptidase [Candidatus Binataceae bacterium]